jgi:hypothetical protein
VPLAQYSKPEAVAPISQKGHNSMTGILSGLLTDEQLAAELHCTPRTLNEYGRRPNGMPFVKVAGRVMSDPEAVRDWLLKQARAPRNVSRSVSRKRGA